IRDIPFVMSSGQAAGIAAAQCAARKVQPREADVAELQQALEALGVPLHMPKTS
ncbi:MAG: FAD-dependent oxidoreductase, partial [Planctomycetes bacterium]|nr:FAD-dependent oxidoreductase [Planctomycetota bacterium]